MDLKEKVRIARRAIDKKWDYEALKYGDDLYGKEQHAPDIWELVNECEEMGTKAFYHKYRDL